MKRIVCISALSLACLSAFAQDQDNAASVAAAASRQEAQENYNTLRAQVDDLIKGQEDLNHRIEALAKDIADMRQEVSKPNASYAGQDELRKLADAVQEIDKKREADKELILEKLKELGAVISATPPERPHHPVTHPGTAGNSDSGNSTSNSSNNSNHGDQTGFYYVIKPNDSLSLIAKAYREQGIHVTTKQIQEANPNVNPNKLLVGNKLFIPAPSGSVPKSTK